MWVVHSYIGLGKISAKKKTSVLEVVLVAAVVVVVLLVRLLLCAVVVVTIYLLVGLMWRWWVLIAAVFVGVGVLPGRVVSTTSTNMITSIAKSTLNVTPSVVGVVILSNISAAVVSIIHVSLLC